MTSVILFPELIPSSAALRNIVVCIVRGGHGQALAFFLPDSCDLTTFIA